MKNYIFFLLLVLTTGCCKDSFIGPVDITILKDNKPLNDQNIYPTFYYKDKNGSEVNLHFEALTTESKYLINQSSELEKLSFTTAFIYIKYIGLPETDTLEILLDYDCNQKSKCSCHDIILKYMKCNGEVLTDYTLRK